MRTPPAPTRSLRAPRPRCLVLAAVLLLAAALAGCGSSARGLIPSGAAQPLLADFEAVQRTAEQGGGDCTSTEEALAKAEHDFDALPSTVNAGLRNRLRLGIENLGARARERCTEPAAGSNSGAKTTPKSTTSTPTTTTPPATGPTSTTGPTGEEGETEKSSGSTGSESGGSEAPGTHEGQTESPGGEEAERHREGGSPGREEDGAGGLEISR